MFYKNLLSTKKTKNKEFVFDCFSLNPRVDEENDTIPEGEAKLIYNFISENKSLKTGYGLKDLQMPISTSDVYYEEPISLRGNDVKTMWKMKWYDKGTNQDKYYLFYFNNENMICYDNLFTKRNITLIIPNEFKTTPYVCFYRNNGVDSLLLSSQDVGLMIITGDKAETNKTAPQIISCCSHYGKLFAITAEARGRLVYIENTNIMSWDDSKTKKLDFSDERGDLNKIISFEDNLYLFRDYGITRISEYGSGEEFAINHMYLSNHYIYPNSIVQYQDKIFFFDNDGIKIFDGNSVKNIDIKYLKLSKNCDNRNCYGICFENKYFLACRLNFSDNQKLGCENSVNGYLNNAVIVYNISSGHIDIMRGVDIRQMLVLSNPYKTKLIASFNNDYKNKIGEFTLDGCIFENKNQNLFYTGYLDFSLPGVKKKIKYLLIRSKFNCKIEIKNEKINKIINLRGKESLQKLRVNLTGTQFEIKITNSEAKSNISSLILGVEIPV